MSRQFLTDNVDSAPVHSEANDAATTAAKVAVAHEQVLNEALAGALPVWDLLPASPFVRRVK